MHGELLNEFGSFNVRNLNKLDTAIFVYRELNNLHPQVNNSFQMLDYLHSYNTRSVSTDNLFIPRRGRGGGGAEFSENYGISAGSKIWNEISKEIRMAQTLHSFKEHLKTQLAV